MQHRWLERLRAPVGAARRWSSGGRAHERHSGARSRGARGRLAHQPARSESARLQRRALPLPLPARQARTRAGHRQRPLHRRLLDLRRRSACGRHPRRERRPRDHRGTPRADALRGLASATTCRARTTNQFWSGSFLVVSPEAAAHRPDPRAGAQRSAHGTTNTGSHIMRTTLIICSLLALPAGAASAADSPGTGPGSSISRRASSPARPSPIRSGPAECCTTRTAARASFDFGLDGKEYKSWANRTTSMDRGRRERLGYGHAR